MSRPLSEIAEQLGGETAATLEGLRAQVARDRKALSALFPGLPRRTSRRAVGGGPTPLGPGTVDLDAFRACDLAAAWLLLACAVTDDELRDLFLHGDLDERAMLLRALHLMPIGPVTIELFGEVQRTNVLLHVEAAVCDGDLFTRVVGHPDFDLEAANKLLLKCAFLGLPLQRALGAETHANTDLSRMLQDLATEREVAGREVWRDTWRLIGLAPTAGSAARLVGGLEHGDDGVRLAAAEGLLALDRADLRPFAAERLPREPRPAIRALLQRIAGR